MTDDGSGLAAIGYLYYADEAAAIAGNTTTGSCTDYTVVSDQTAWGEAGQDKWYVVNSNVTISDRITASGDVHLILSDGCTLTASKGIGVTDGNSLTIYGQSADESTMGVLKSQNALSNNAAIGGESSISSGQITINGGKITVKGGNNAAGIGGGRSGKGSVTVNGGVVTVNANSGSEGSAGIGGGYRGSGVVTINGGTVSANGREGGAGIGGGGYGAATVTVNGGSVTARGGGFGVGIGSGSGSQIDRSYTAAVTINGGTVDAYTGSGSGYKGAAIGCGAHTHGTVTITGGNVTATTYNSGACIGGIVNDTGTNSLVTITGGNVTAKAASNNLTSYAGIGGSNCDVILGWTNETDSITSPKWGGNGSSTVSFAEGKSFQYEDTHSLADAASLRDGATLIPFVPAAQKNVDQADVSGVRAWYPYTGSAIEPEPVVTYAGTALTKETDYTLSYTSDHTSIGEKTVTITGKGNYTGTKTIYYQIVEASTTYLDDTGTSQTCATFQCLDQSDTALSAGWYLVYDDLTINDRVSLSGDVNLILKDGKTLTSMKGISVPGTASLTVYAQSSSESTAGKLLITDPEMFFSGIGNDYKLSDRDSHGNITIVGGVIEAKGGISGAAIGSALSASQGGNIVIKGGFVTANGTGGGAGIGSGANTDGGMVTINGGKVTATSIGGAAIGSGGFGDGKGSFGTINITGGTVSAKSESGGAGIGGGSNSAGGTISITGGTVTASASGDTGGAGIGGGRNAAGGSITVQNATIARAAANAGAGIGSGGGESAGTTTVIIGTGATVTNAVSEDGAGIGSGKNSSAACSVTIRDGADVTAKSTIGAGIGGGAGASNFSVTIQDKNTTVNAWAGGIGIQDGNGNLSAYGGAAIGGGANVNGGTVNIEGGTVTAKAIGGGAGIGSGTNTKRDATETNSGTITISGGTVTAAATHRAAGIGGGRRSNGGTITISGGTIVANGSDAAGIGHGGEDTLWEGQGNYYVPIVTDPTQDVGGAWYDSIVQISGTNKTTTDGNVTFSYAGGGTVSITASSYPSAPTLSKDFMYSDNGVKVVATSITGEKTIIPYSAHLHSFTYSASGATITATCSAANCPLASSQAMLTINAPAELIYDGTAKAATVIGEIPGVTTPDITYTRTGDDTFTGMPTNAGSYIASITVEGATASVSYAIAPKPVTVTAKAQSVAIGGSIATGMDQATLTGALDGHTLTSVTLTSSSTEAATTEGTITPSVATVMNGETDVTANYNISYENGVLTVMPVVTFDSNGGSAVDTQTVNPGSKATKPTDPTNSNARFMGWYQVTDGQTANTAFDFETAVNESIDLKAKWGYEITPQYNVLGSIGFISGMVESNGYYGIVGENVVLSLTPNENCILTALTNNDVDVMGSVVNGRYTFTMPSGDVTVSATFKQLYTVSVSKNALITQTFTVNSQEVTPIDADEYNMTLQIPAGAVVSITAAPVDSSEYRIEDIDIRREDPHDHFGTVTDGENGARTATFTMPESEVNVHVNVQETGWPVNTGVPVYDGENVIFKVTATPHHGEAGTPITLTVEKAGDVTLESMDYVYYDNAAGEEITVSLTPDADGKYTFTMPDSWVSVRPEYSLNRAHKIINELGDGPSVYLVFRKDEYNMFTVETTTANAGDTVRVYPNGGTLQGFKVNGKEVAVSGYESDPYYEFTMPDGNATLTGLVTYSLQTYRVEHGTVTVQVGDGEAIDMSGGTWLSVPAGAQVKVTATPVAGYTLYRLTYRMDGQYGRGSDEKGGVEIQSGVPFTMPRGNIVIDAEFSTPWNHLRNQIDNARDGDTITLTEDATAPAGEGCLGISYKSITVDLNGHTINRNLTAPTDYGCVISVDSSAALTLVDSTGRGMITGGNNNYNGGGIAVAGTLNLQGGKITGNSASDGGGVAVISSGAVFNLTGGEISGNANTSSRSSAGVLYTSGAMNVSGSPVVTDAVYVDLNRKLHVTGPLTNATPIPVIIAGGVSVPFTDGLPNNGSAANFKSANEDYRVRVNNDGEAELYAPTFYTVTFDGLSENGNSYSITQRVAEGETATWPEQGTVQDGQAIVGWQDILDGAMFDFNTPITDDIELVAMWETAYLITLDVTGNGTLSVDTNNDGIPEQFDGSTQVFAAVGQTVAVTVTPAAKHMAVYDEKTGVPGTVTDGDGEAVGVYYDLSSIDTYTFVMPASPVTVSAEFVEAEYGISIQYTAVSGSYDYHDGIAVTVDGEPAKVADNYLPLAKPDQTVALDVTPAPGYALVGITGDYNDWNDQQHTLTISQSADDPNHWTFTMPDGTPTLTAQFRKLPAATFMDGETVCATLYPDPATNLLTRPDDPTKEGHRFLGWYQDDTEFDFDTPITEDITLTARWAEPVTLSAYTRTDNNALALGNATVTDGTIYTGDTVTVSVKSQNGYSFLGWYKATEFSDGNVTAYGEKVASTLKYTFDIMEDTALVAVYRENKKVTLTVSTGNGAKFLVEGSATEQTDFSQAYAVGTKVTLTAVDADSVLNWQNESNKIISTAASIVVTVSENKCVKLMYKAQSANQAFVQFIDDYDGLLAYRNYSTSDTVVNFPDAPTKFGYQFVKWVFDGTNTEATSETILAKVGTDSNIIVRPMYEQLTTTYSVTVRYVDANGGSIGDGLTVYSDLQIGTSRTFDAPAIEGYKFSSWENMSGVVLSNKSGYYMKVEADVTLTVRYVTEDTEVEVKPIITIGELYTVATNDGIHKVANTATRSIPDGYTLIEHGFLYARNAAVTTSEGFVLGGEGVSKYTSNKTGMSGVVKLNVKVDNDDVVVTLRGFMTLRNNSTGNEETYYTNVTSGSFTSVNQ